MKMRIRSNDAVNLLVFSEQLGIPLMNSYVSMRLLPYFVGELEGWKRREMREREILEEAPEIHKRERFRTASMRPERFRSTPRRCRTATVSPAGCGSDCGPSSPLRVRSSNTSPARIRSVVRRRDRASLPAELRYGTIDGVPRRTRPSTKER